MTAEREDEDKAGSIGVNTPTYKMLGFICSAVFVGMAGGVYGYYLTFVDPIGMLGLMTATSLNVLLVMGSIRWLANFQIGSPLNQMSILQSSIQQADRSCKR